MNCDYFSVMPLVVCNIRGSLTACGNLKFDIIHALVFYTYQKKLWKMTFKIEVSLSDLLMKGNFLQFLVLYPF